MSANTISEYWNFLPAYILRPRHSKHSTESSSYSWGSSTFSLRTGSYFTETAVRQENRGAPPLPPPRKINAAQQLAPRKAKTGTGNLVSLRKKLRVKESSHSRDSNYHQIKQRGLLCQRRVLAIFSVFTFSVSLCTVLLLGFQISVLFRKLLPEAIHQREDAITRHYNSSNEDYLVSLELLLHRLRPLVCFQAILAFPFPYFNDPANRLKPVSSSIYSIGTVHLLSISCLTSWSLSLLILK